MDHDKPSIAVFYLAREAEGHAALQRFADSYRQHHAGVAHVLVPIYKGFSSAAALQRAREVFSGLASDEVLLNDDMLDIGAYIDAASRCNARYVCFMNTHATLRAPGWLSALYGALRGDGNVGLAGMHGSYESLYLSSALVSKAIWLASTKLQPFDADLLAHFRFAITPVVPDYGQRRRSVRQVLSGLRRDSESLWQKFWDERTTAGDTYGYLSAFPRTLRPHIRSNGFMVLRETLLRHYPRIAPTKEAAYAFESGPESLSDLVKRDQRTLVVVGTDGRTYGEAAWHSSKTFRALSTRHSFLDDNQTRAFAALSPLEQQTLMMMTWGVSSDGRANVCDLGFDFSVPASIVNQALSDRA